GGVESSGVGTPGGREVRPRAESLRVAEKWIAWIIRVVDQLTVVHCYPWAFRVQTADAVKGHDVGGQGRSGGGLGAAVISIHVSGQAMSAQRGIDPGLIVGHIVNELSEK